MIGDHGDDIMEMDEVNTVGYGVLPRAVKELFREAKRKQDAEGTLVQVVVSYMEIYNDRLYDLLQPYKQGTNRCVRMQRSACLLGETGGGGSQLACGHGWRRRVPVKEGFDRSLARPGSQGRAWHRALGTSAPEGASMCAPAPAPAPCALRAPSD